MLIKEIIARQVLDVTGKPTVECTLNGKPASVPSGTSAGAHEAKAIDAGKAVESINTAISTKIIEKNFSSQQDLDRELMRLDGKKDKSLLGANSILAVSMAFCKAYAEHKNLQLYEYLSQTLKTKPLMPVPQFNLINSGKHAGKDILDIQEHMIMPVGAESFSHALKIGKEVYGTLESIVKNKYPVKLGLENGFIIKSTVEERLEMILSAVSECGYDNEVRLALDCAASEFFVDEKYIINGKKFDSMELIDFYKELVEKYPIVSIEDGLNEEDFDNWAEMSKKIRIQVVGDDLITTSIERIKKALVKKSCNAFILKPNQIGTVSEALEAANIAKISNWNVVVSHRSRETEDTFIADLASAVGDQCKFGAPAKDRLLKYNRLLEIEKTSKAGYAKFKL